MAVCVDSFFFDASPETPALDENVLQVGTSLFALAGAPASDCWHGGTRRRTPRFLALALPW